MPPDIFEFQDYKVFLKKLISSYPDGGRGIRKKLSVALGCQMPFLSHVLSGDCHLSSEQAFDVGNFFEFNEEEFDYFSDMLLLARASKNGFKQHLLARLKAKRNRRSSADRAIGIQDQLLPQDQAVYYSHWSYAAVHMALLLPGTSGREVLSKRFRLTNRQISNVLEFLLSKGLVSLEMGKFQVEKTFLHLSKDSPLLGQHHRNLRLLASESAFAPDEEALHYSSFVSLSRNSLRKIREQLNNSLENCANTIRESQEECIAVLNIDLFEVPVFGEM